MIPVVTPEEMAQVDAEADESTDVLIARAGAAVALAAYDMLGGSYGRRVVVLAGKGNNGGDGRAAAGLLRARGIKTSVIEVADAGAKLPVCDLVIDAAFGTGFHGEYSAPELQGTPLVLAVDIPSGVSGPTGEAEGRVLIADRTVTFAAFKPGLLLGAGPELAGEIVLADIGLDVSEASIQLVEANDVAAWLPTPKRDTHKWKSALWIVAGSAGMTGAAHLATRAAQRAGAGYVRLSSPGVTDDPQRPTESVGWELPADDWANNVLDNLDRFAALVVGPGLGDGESNAEQVLQLASSAALPLLLDGDALTAIGTGWSNDVADRPVVLTPHDGEFARIGGAADNADRIASTRDLAQRTGAVVLRKGPTTVVAEPGGQALLSNTGDARLATAGSGDVLTGLIGALLAQGMSPFHAAAAGAFLHGRAGSLGPRSGLVAGDIPVLISELLSQLMLEP